MRIAHRLRAALPLFCVIVALGAGCSTARPVRNERQGLLDRIALADHSRKSNQFGKISRSPAAPVGSVHSAVEVAPGALHWPLARVEITSQFGSRGRDFHEGIDLRAKKGTTVFAAQDGVVLYAGSKIRGYGRMVVIRHAKELSTVYAHNSQVLVRIGQKVKQGQRIAITGSTGRSTGPHLHFEIRDGMSALDPLEVMPAPRRVTVASTHEGAG